MSKSDRIARGLAVATAAFVSVPGAVYAQGLDGRRRVRRRELPPRFNITVGGSYSRVDVNSSFGIGTRVLPRRELYVAAIPSYVERSGFDIGVEVPHPGGYLLGPSSRGMLEGRFSYAEGDAKGSGAATVGEDGVTKVGLTLLEEDGGLGTGVGDDIPGLSVEGFARINNSWSLATLRYCETLEDHPGEGADFHVGVVGAYERFDQEFSASADLILNESLVADQQTRGSTEDSYIGLGVVAGVTYYVSPTVSVNIEGEILPSYHKGEGSLRQLTDFGGPVEQERRYSDSGLTVSGAIRAGVGVELSPRLSLSLQYEYSRLGAVTEVHVPANPDEQPASFDSEAIDRHFARLQVSAVFSDIRLKRDIVPLARLDNGLMLYRYRYLWSDTLYVGVMAQEVQSVVPEAVMRGPDGFLRVDYARLGLELKTWEAWRAKRDAALAAPIAVDGPTRGKEVAALLN